MNKVLYLFFLIFTAIRTEYIVGAVNYGVIRAHKYEIQVYLLIDYQQVVFGRAFESIPQVSFAINKIFITENFIENELGLFSKILEITPQGFILQSYSATHTIQSVSFKYLAILDDRIQILCVNQDQQQKYIQFHRAFEAVPTVSLFINGVHRQNSGDLECLPEILSINENGVLLSQQNGLCLLAASGDVFRTHTLAITQASNDLIHIAHERTNFFVGMSSLKTQGTILGVQILSSNNEELFDLGDGLAQYTLQIFEILVNNSQSINSNETIINQDISNELPIKSTDNNIILSQLGVEEKSSHVLTHVYGLNGKQTINVYSASKKYQSDIKQQVIREVFLNNLMKPEKRPEEQDNQSNISIIKQTIVKENILDQQDPLQNYSQNEQIEKFTGLDQKDEISQVTQPDLMKNFDFEIPDVLKYREENMEIMEQSSTNIKEHNFLSDQQQQQPEEINKEADNLFKTYDSLILDDDENYFDSSLNNRFLNVPLEEIKQTQHETEEISQKELPIQITSKLDVSLQSETQQQQNQIIEQTKQIENQQSKNFNDVRSEILETLHDQQIKQDMLNKKMQENHNKAINVQRVVNIELNNIDIEKMAYMNNLSPDSEDVEEIESQLLQLQKQLRRKEKIEMQKFQTQNMVSNFNNTMEFENQQTPTKLENQQVSPTVITKSNEDILSQQTPFENINKRKNPSDSFENKQNIAPFKKYSFENTPDMIKQDQQNIINKKDLMKDIMVSDDSQTNIKQQPDIVDLQKSLDLFDNNIQIVPDMVQNSPYQSINVQQMEQKQIEIQLIKDIPISKSQQIILMLNNLQNSWPLQNDFKELNNGQVDRSENQLIETNNGDYQPIESQQVIFEDSINDQKEKLYLSSQTYAKQFLETTKPVQKKTWDEYSKEKQKRKEEILQELIQKYTKITEQPIPQVKYTQVPTSTDYQFELVYQDWVLKDRGLKPQIQVELQKLNQQETKSTFLRGHDQDQFQSK